MKTKPAGLNDQDWVWALGMVKDWVKGGGRHSHHYAAALKANWVSGLRIAAYWEVIRSNVRSQAFDE